jgi:hypothetical protein
MKAIVYTRPDGGCSIVHPAPGARRPKETEAEFIERIRQKDVPKDATNVRVVGASEVPADRTFRNAWKSDLTVDMVKAREIHREHLRQMRAPLLQALDVEYQIADERGDTTEKQRVATLKQALRDVTKDPAIEAASTPEAIKAVVPAALR